LKSFNDHENDELNAIYSIRIPVLHYLSICNSFNYLEKE